MLLEIIALLIYALIWLLFPRTTTLLTLIVLLLTGGSIVIP